MSEGRGPQLGKKKVVEIVGVAGTGKTTLYQALGHYSAFVQLENFPDVRKFGDAPFFVSNGLQLIPSLLRLYRPNCRQLTRRELAWMSILLGWSTLLRKQSRNSNKVVVLDQGPLYLLAEMRLFGPEYLKQKAAEGLWRCLYDRWGGALDMILWLDAPDEVLLERIRTRQQEHIVKDQPATVAYEFLNRYRAEYEFLLSTFMAHHARIKVVRIDTGRQQTQNIVNSFLSEISC